MKIGIRAGMLVIPSETDMSEGWVVYARRRMERMKLTYVFSKVRVRVDGVSL